jgi:hypothetical protein
MRVILIVLLSIAGLHALNILMMMTKGISTRLMPRIRGMKPTGVVIRRLKSFLAVSHLKYSKDFSSGKEELTFSSFLPYRYLSTVYEPELGVVSFYEKQIYLFFKKETGLWGVAGMDFFGMHEVPSDNPHLLEKIAEAEKLFDNARNRFAKKVEKARAKAEK